MDFPISVPSIGLVDGKFVDEDPLSGSPGSLIPSAWGNAVTFEVLNVIEAAGLAPDEDNNAQLLQAISAMLATATPEATETVLGLVKRATQLQVDAGTNDTAVVTPKKLATAVQNQTLTAFTTAGTATALTLTPTPAIQAYAPYLRFSVKFSVTGGLNPTLNVSGKGPKSLKQYDSTGTKVAAVFFADQVGDVVYDGTDWVLINAINASPDATDTVKGVVELATAAELLGGTDAVRAATAAGLLAGFLGSGGTSGTDWVKIPFRDKTTGVRRELIIQWTTVTSVGASAPNFSGSWPMTFPNGLLGCVATPVTSTSGLFAQYNTRSLSGFTGQAQAYNALSNGIPVSLIAVGW
ncbi:gp53-like domain-containing protein [Pseudomonas fluorescens]|uniref:gp53-like domain-containing protein n=1 Tax=Pseudomonas fluorescens TaxID=294 RepID=UPI00030E0AB1|nr:hypothetical protein [Pseudomonas fluorescens]